MDSDNESYHNESEFYYPDEENVLQENKNFGNTSNGSEDEEMTTIQNFIEAQRPENTTSKTTYDINVWKRFCSSIGEAREIETIPAANFDVLLCKFFMDTKKENGGVYEPTSLTSFQRRIQRYLEEKNSTFNLFQDMEFVKSREVFLAKKRELVEKYAKGNRPQAVRSITLSEEDLLFRTKQFGDHNPEVLQRTVWWVYHCTLDLELETSPGS